MDAINIKVILFILLKNSYAYVTNTNVLIVRVNISKVRVFITYQNTKFKV